VELDFWTRFDDGILIPVLNCIPSFSFDTLVFTGKVFLVKENKTGEIYALKVLRKDNIIKRNQVEHTNTERSVLGYVRHPFIVGMNMAFQSKDKLYFVLDYCAGGELFFQLGKLGKFKESRARFYAAEIILAIRYVSTTCTYTCGGLVSFVVLSIITVMSTRSILYIEI
jgi:serine/threonine protein kinase